MIYCLIGIGVISIILLVLCAKTGNALLGMFALWGIIAIMTTFALNDLFKAPITSTQLTDIKLSVGSIIFCDCMLVAASVLFIFDWFRSVIDRK